VRSACAEALGALGARAPLVDAVGAEADPFVVIFIERALWKLDRQRRQSRSTVR
jgi:HEAT repeat protein